MSLIIFNSIIKDYVPIQFVLEQGQDAHDWNDVHLPDVVVDYQVKHGQVEQSLKKFKLILSDTTCRLVLPFVLKYK